MISKAEWNCDSIKKEIAIKVFKGEVTSDGFPEDEMNACILAGNHKNLVTVLGKIHHHPEQKMGLVLELIPPSFKNLAGPPSFDTCTRDTFREGTSFSSDTILKISKSIADAARHLHSKGIMHGDLYAHNTLFDKEARRRRGARRDPMRPSSGRRRERPGRRNRWAGIRKGRIPWRNRRSACRRQWA